MAYTKTVWVNNSTPSINATNLNKIENGIFDVDAAVASLSASVGAGIAAGSIVYAYKNFGGAL